MAARNLHASGLLGGSGATATAGQAQVTADEADLFEGIGHVHGTVCCAPELVAHVASELEKESKIQKEARKAREEKALQRGGKQGN